MSTIVVARKGGEVARSVIPCLFLIVSLWLVVDEVQFRSEMVRTFATVREWRSEKWGGYQGIAKADIDFEGLNGISREGSIRTSLWYRPSPGERIPVYYHRVGGSAPGRVDSVWQGFLLPTILGLVALGWLVEFWCRGRTAKTSDQGGQEPYPPCSGSG